MGREVSVAWSGLELTLGTIIGNTTVDLVA